MFFRETFPTAVRYGYERARLTYATDWRERPGDRGLAVVHLPEFSELEVWEDSPYFQTSLAGIETGNTRDAESIGFDFGELIYHEANIGSFEWEDFTRPGFYIIDEGGAHFSLARVRITDAGPAVEFSARPSCLASELKEAVLALRVDLGDWEEEDDEYTEEAA